MNENERSEGIFQENRQAPAHTYLIELTGSGFTGVRTDLDRSGGKALVLVHPFMRQYAHADELAKEDRYRASIGRVIQKATQQDCPVICYLEAPLKSPYVYYRGNDLLGLVTQIAHQALESSGSRISEKNRVYYIPTLPFSPTPLGGGGSLDEVSNRLKRAGLTYAVLGGGYFSGGVMEDISAYYRLSRDDVVGRQFFGERQNKVETKPHVLEEIEVVNCMGAVMRSFAKNDIRFRVGRGITYDRLVPKWSELTQDQEKNRYTSKV